MTKLVLSLIGGCLLLSGCPLDGNDGSDGSAGIQGPIGLQGSPGISCWDLNENGVKDVDTEDTNQSGSVDVNDCIIGNGGVPSTTRQHYASYAVGEPEYLEVFRHTNFPNGEVIDPLQDACSVWEWNTNSLGNAALTANNGYVISVKTYPHIYTDLNNVTHYGYDDCTAACLAKSDCIGASYTGIDDNQGATTAISCQLLGRFPVSTQSAEWFYEFSAPPANRDFYFSGFLTDRVATGIISVCP